MKAADERAHEPGPGDGWWETWHLDAATQDGVGLSVRLACAPVLGIAWWWTYLVLPDLPGPVVVRDHEVGLPRQGLEIRADGLWGELTCETPFEHWTYGVEAFGVRLDDPHDALRGEIGERLPVGLDIEWEVEPGEVAPHEYAAGWPVTGYEQPGAVRGEVLLGRAHIELDAIGVRSHSWGASPIDGIAQTAWMVAPGIEASFGVLADGRADGYVRTRGEPAAALTGVQCETRRDADDLPVVARYVVGHDLEIDAEVLGLAPVPVGDGAVLVRALCRFDAGAATDDGDPRVGNGWATWLDRG